MVHKFPFQDLFTKNVLISASLILILGIGGCAAYVGHQNLQVKRANNIRSQVVVEAGTEQISAVQFLKKESNSAVLETELDTAALETPGTYPVIIAWHNEQYTSFVKVQDTVAPTGTVRNLTVLDRLPDPREFVLETQDITSVTASYKYVPDVTAQETQRVIIVLTDSSGNATELTAFLTMLHDTKAPVIEGVPKTLTVYEGETIAYRNGVTVTDDYYKSIDFSVNSDGVDLSKPGEYPLVYSATDGSGNTTTVETTVQVYKRPSEYAEKEEILEEVDKILAKIIRKDMTTYQQVEAIYQYIRTHCDYGNYPVKVNYLQAAHFMITKGYGDCYNYFSLAKAMFEQLGIPNIDVQKIKNYKGDSNHYWSLVSVDGGKTYYHVDCTPRYGPGDDFCLVTDAQLDAYSARHGHCHNRDKSLYPATPEENHAKDQ